MKNKKSTLFSTGRCKIPAVVGESILNLFFPRRCPGCDEILWPGERSEGFCEKCSAKIHRISDRHCKKCGKELENEAEYCRDCGKNQHFFTENKAVYLYRGIMKGAMYRFKYSNRREYARVFAKDAARLYGNHFRRMGVQVIVPVPMYEKKKRKRGYNQAEVFGKALAKEMDLPMDNNLIRRIRDTEPQKNLNPMQRKYNLKKAFKIRKNVVKLNRVLVVDDIYTTGSTLDGVAEELLSSGVDEVYCLSVCIGKGN
jgi:ComF family protein